KCNDRSSNGRGLQALQISSVQEDFEVALERAELVVFVGRNDVELIERKGYDKSIVALCSFDIKKEIELFLPIASHTSRSGTFINVDGFVQFSACAIETNHGTQSLISLLATILGDNILTCKDIWDDELGSLEVFASIDFEALQNDTLRINL
ncbi:MAG: NADH-quinone oxidoreductase subunit G, partial [Sulfurospirillaceae bacterium]|nr:NADH-quinone oxidoreductase subunit G [Sulfurospirillaceae bacterium]